VRAVGKKLLHEERYEAELLEYCAFAIDTSGFCATARLSAV